MAMLIERATRLGVVTATVSEMLDEIERLQQRIEELEKRGEWQPMDTAPKDRPIIISDGETVASGWWYTGGEVPDRWMPLNTPTHWMPLPAAPSPEDKAQG